MAVTLGLILATANVSGQDRIRIVETPRTAMRETRSVATPPGEQRAERERDGAPGETPVVYVEHFVTEMRDQYRAVYVPVIENQTEPVTAWWNPLGITPRTFQPRPVVRWKQRVEKTRVPVRYRELVPQTQESLQAATSVASSNAGATRATTTESSRASTPPRRSVRGADRKAVQPEPQFGGISRLDSDRPRYGTRVGPMGQRVIR